MRTELLASLKAFRDEYRADRDKKAEGSRAVTVATISGIFLVVAAIVTAVAAVIGS